MTTKYPIVLKNISILVFILHIIIVLTLLPSATLSKTSQKMIVREKVLPSSAAVPILKKSNVKKSFSKVSNTNKSKAKPITKNTTALVDEIEKSLAILSENTSHTKQVNIPQKIQYQVNIQQHHIENMYTYESALVKLLQEALQFEEYGDVKLEITISANGNLLSFKTIESKNNLNETYLKNQLPKLSFPCFNAYNIPENSLTFTIQFCNTL